MYSHWAVAHSPKARKIGEKDGTHILVMNWNALSKMIQPQQHFLLTTSVLKNYFSIYTVLLSMHDSHSGRHIISWRCQSINEKRDTLALFWKRAPYTLNVTPYNPNLGNGQSQGTQTIQWANQNSKQIHVADAKREKTCASESRQSGVSAFSQSRTEVIQNQIKCELHSILNWKPR